MGGIDPYRSGLRGARSAIGAHGPVKLFHRAMPTKQFSFVNEAIYSGGENSRKRGYVPISPFLWLDYGGGIHDTLAKAVANFPVQFFCSLDNQHVGSAGDTGIHRTARLHLDDLA